MKRRVWWAVIVMLALIVLLAYIGSALGPGPRGRFPSSLAPDPEGLLAFRRTLERLGIPTETLKEPWSRFVTDDPEGVLLVATPLQRRPEADESDALLGWLARGGSLLVIDDATTLERSLTLDKLLSQVGLDARTPVSDLDRQTLALARPDLQDCSGTPARPSDAALGEISLHESSAFEPTARGIPLAMGRYGDVLAASMPLGDGTVVRVLGPLLANDRISAGDNLTFALRLFEDLAAEGTVWFDEYHHGLGGRIGGEHLDRAALVWSTLQVLFATLLFLLARGIRFGPLRVEPEPTRRSSLEFVRSMASLYRRARAHKHVLAGSRDRFVREARVRWGLAEDLDTQQLAHTVAHISGLDKARVEKTLRGAAEAGRQPRIGEKTMKDRVRDLARLEQEAFGECEPHS